jgi:hypothetical protein
VSGMSSLSRRRSLSSAWETACSNCERICASSAPRQVISIDNGSRHRRKSACVGLVEQDRLDHEAPPPRSGTNIRRRQSADHGRTLKRRGGVEPVHVDTGAEKADAGDHLGREAGWVALPDHGREDNEAASAERQERVSSERCHFLVPLRSNPIAAPSARARPRRPSAATSCTSAFGMSRPALASVRARLTAARREGDDSPQDKPPGDGEVPAQDRYPNPGERGLSRRHQFAERRYGQPTPH